MDQQVCSLFCPRASKDIAEKCSKCNFDERMKRRICGTDFSFFCSISVPEAGPEELRTMCDWGNWVDLNFIPKTVLEHWGLGLMSPYSGLSMG